ncbi:MAG: DJ-1/PfpI family protein [Lachnospiraceae bacterium]|nr:DJ-1/PfpI family protein [Lachnospiraceae bacterium]
MKKIYLFLADGFEEIEGLAVVDLCRRAKLECITVSITDNTEITGSHGIRLYADRTFADGSLDDADMLVLPGGMPGTKHLLAHEGLKELLCRYAANQKYLAAICAAPSVLGNHGLLQGKKATCFPGFEEKLLGATALDAPVVIDGNIITSRGFGTAIDFGLAIVETLLDTPTAAELAATIQYKK